MSPCLHASVLSFLMPQRSVTLHTFSELSFATCFPASESAPAFKMVRAVLVTATSLALTGAVVAHAYLLKHQFYPTVVYLTKSSPSMAVSGTK